MTAAPLYAGVELGGTKCVCTLAAGPDAIVEQSRIATTTPAETLPAIADVLDRWAAGHAIAGLGIASFGPLHLEPASPRHGRITATTKGGWRDVQIAQPLAASVPAPMRIDTDVAGAALAEGRWGAARGLSTYCYVTIGTGVGVGIVVGGVPVAGLGHPEAGHMHVARLPGDAWTGACAFHGDCVEGLVSGPAIAARAGAPAETLASDHPAWSSVAHAIAGMCHNLVTTVAPERILIGGGVATGRPELLDEVRRRLVESLGGYGDAASIGARIERYVSAPALGEQAGPLGSIALAIDADACR